MSDHRNSQQNGSPWMRPLQSQQLIRNNHTRQNPAPAGVYTPNEPDGNESVYAARAAQARQQAAARQQTFAAPVQPDAETVSPVQQAVEQAAQQARVVRMNSGAPNMGGYVYASPVAQQPAQPDAVFYQQSTGVQQPAQPDAHRPAQPPQPHRMPSHPYGYAQAAQQQGSQAHSQGNAAYGSMSRQADAAALADPMLMEEAAQTGSPRRRSRMVMRQEQEPAAAPSAPAEPQPVFAAAPAEDEPAFQQTTAEPDMAIPPIPAAPEAISLSGSGAPAFADTDFSGVDNWFASNPPEEDEEDEGSEECMETSRMPVPAPVSTLDIPKVKRSRAWLKLLLTVMLLVALGSFLWLSGWGEKLYNGGVKLVEQITNPAEKVRVMNVSPEIAAVPATLTVTVTTSQSVSQLRLLDDNGQELPCKIAASLSGDELLWICTLKLSDPYEGFLHTELQGKDGQWRMGSEKRYVQVQ